MVHVVKNQQRFQKVHIPIRSHINKKATSQARYVIHGKYITKTFLMLMGVKCKFKVRSSRMNIERKKKDEITKKTLPEGGKRKAQIYSTVAWTK